VVEQIWSVLLTGHASMNVQEWIVTNKAREALRKLFMTADPPCWDEGLCGQKAGELPMEGPDITLTPGFGIVRRTIPKRGICVAEFLPKFSLTIETEVLRHRICLECIPIPQGGQRT
jgi:hypothetical protein